MGINLNEHEGDYNNEEGTYNVLITGFKKEKNINGTWFGILSYKKSDTGKSGTIRVPLNEKSYWIWANIANAAQLTREQKSDFDPEMLIRKDICATFAKERSPNGKVYLEADVRSFCAPQGSGLQGNSTPMVDTSKTQSFPDQSDSSEDDLPF